MNGGGGGGVGGGRKSVQVTIPYLFSNYSKRSHSQVINMNGGGGGGGRKRVRVKESEDDIFGRLPDDIFHYILSLLPTKDLVRTSVLSKKWVNLWTYSTNIDINHMHPTFIYSVEQVLLYCHAPYFQKFRLSSGAGGIYGVRVRACRIRSWVSSAIHHRVQELYLSLRLGYGVDDDYNVVLPPCFFTSNSLTAVKLHLSYSIKIPSSSICLPNLKKLHLYRTIFLEEQSTQRFFSGLPALEELFLIGCAWRDMRKVTINCPSLKSLTYSSYCFDLKVRDLEINIYASNLSSFHCTCTLECKLVLHGLESLVDAVIVLVDKRSHDKDEYLQGLDILRKVHRAKTLKVSESVSRILWWVQDHGEVRLPMFYNLKRLVIRQIFPENVKGLAILLGRSPNLEIFEMGKGMKPDGFDKHDWSLKSDNLCFKSNLKKFRISDFTGNEAEMYFIKFMLKKCPSTGDGADKEIGSKSGFHFIY